MNDKKPMADADTATRLWDIENKKRLAEERAKLSAEYIPSPNPHDPKAPVGIRTRPCVPYCPVCNGYGYIPLNPDALPGDKDFGKVDFCPKVDRLTVPEQQEIIGITEFERDNMTWDILIRHWGNVDTAISAIQRTLERGWGFVYLYGQFGMAKSTLLKIAIAETLRNDGKGAYSLMPDIIQHLRRAFIEEDRYTRNDDEDRRFEFWKNIPILAIDEMEEMRDTSYAAEKQFMLINHRHEKAILERNMITIMAGNDSPADALRTKIADRIFDGRHMVIQLEGESMRPYMKSDFRF